MATARTLLKSNKILKKQIASTFDISKKQVQELIDDLMIHAEENDWVISPITCEAWAEANTDSKVYEVLSGYDTSVEKQAVLKAIFSQLTYVVGKDNKIYQITTVEEE